MKVFTRAGSTWFHQTPSCFSALATMTPSTMPRMSLALSGVTPLPTSVGRCGGLLDHADVAQIRSVPGALAGRDDGVGVEEDQILDQLLHRAVGNDRMRAMLDMSIGEDADAVGAQPGAVARRAARLALDEALIGDIGVGPLVDADEARAAALAMARAGIAALASTLMPIGLPKSRRIRSETTAI